MLATSFTCPECGTLLKLATPVPSGKKIKCPKCTGIFSLPEPSGHPAADLSPYGDRDRPARPRDSEPEADYPRPREGSPHLQSDRSTGDYERGGLDNIRVRPRQPRLTRSPQPARTGMTIGLILGGLVLAAGLFAVAAWVWPGFWKKATPIAGQGTEELWAAIPGDCNVFMGVDATAIPQTANQPWTAQQQIDMALKQLPQLPPGTGEFLQILSDMEKVVIAGKIPADGNQNNTLGVAILKTKHPYNAEKIRQLLQTGAPQMLNGKTYYELTQFAGKPIPANPAMPARPYLCMLSDRVVMLAMLPKDRLGEVLVSEGGKTRLSANTLTLLRTVDKSAFWMAVPFEGIVSQKLQQLQPELFGKTPELKRAVGPLKQARGAWMTSNQLSNDGVRLSIGVVCRNGADASQLASAGRDFWNSAPVQNGIGQAKLFFAGPDKQAAGAFLDEFRNGLEFTTDGDTAVVSVDFSKKLTQDFGREIQNKGNPFRKR